MTTEQALAVIGQVLNQTLAAGTVKTMQDAAAILQAWNICLNKINASEKDAQ